MKNDNRSVLTLGIVRGERILIGDDIEFTVEKLAGQKLRIYIKAPRDVQISRVLKRGSEEKDQD